MIKCISDVSQYFYGNLDRDIHGLICELSPDYMPRKESDIADINDFCELLKTKFVNNTCYLYSTLDVYSKMKRHRGLWVNVMDKLQTNTIKPIHFPVQSIDYIDEGYASGICEFPIELAFDVLWTILVLPYSSFSIIGASGAILDLYYLLKEQWSPQSASMINSMCEKYTAIIMAIPGNDGTSLCCFYKQI